MKFDVISALVTVLCTDFGGVWLEGDYVPTNCLVHDYTIRYTDLARELNVEKHQDLHYS